MKPLVRTQRADDDVDESLEYYLKEAPEAAPGFVDALEGAYAFIARNPGAGSPRYAEALRLPGLRAWGLKRYPYLVFYVELADRIEVWRVLHEVRDIPDALRDPG